MNQHKARGARQGMRGLDSALVQRPNPETGAIETLLKVFYAYNVDIGGTAGVNEGDTATGGFTVQADSDFLIQQITGFSYVVTTYAAIATPLATVQITDTGSSFNLFSAPTWWANVFGTAQLPFILPVPRLVAANAKVNVTINLLKETTANNLFQITFIGHRLYKV